MGLIPRKLTDSQIMSQKSHRHNVKSDQLWRDVFIAVCSSSNVDKPSVATMWADVALKEYNSRYSPENKGK